MQHDHGHAPCIRGRNGSRAVVVAAVAVVVAEEAEAVVAAALEADGDECKSVREEVNPLLCRRRES